MAAEQQRPSSRKGSGTGSRTVSPSGSRSGPGHRTGTRPQGHSAVAALLADSIGQPTPHVADAGTRARRTPGDAPGAPTTPRPRVAPPGEPSLVALGAPPPPPLQDVALGLVAVLSETLWRIGARGADLATGAAGRIAGVVRGVSPQYASSWVDGRLLSLADRGRRVREERSEAVSAAMTGAMTSAVTSDAMRDMTVAAVEQATDDVLAVVLPAMLDAVGDRETQQRLDDLMAGLLLRQLPDALEKTLPGVMVRTATRTSLGIVPSLMGALTSGLSGEPGPPGERRAPRP